jgi:hypothetical protein
MGNAVKKSTDEVLEAIKAIQTEADHIIETLREMQKEKMPAGAKSHIPILRDNAIAIKGFALKACLKKEAKASPKRPSDEDE